MGNKPISADKIAALKAKPARTRSTSAANTNPYEPRDLKTWLALSPIMELGDCDNPDCKDRRPHREHPGNTMVVTYQTENRESIKAEAVTMCRICFIDGWLSLAGR